MNLRASIAAASLLTAAALVSAYPGAIRFSAAAASTPALPTAAVVELQGKGGAAAGRVELSESPRGVLMRVEARGLTPGWHGIHLHAKADCSDSTFQNAGGHVHGGEKSVHGLLTTDATDTGDLPNLHAGPDGVARAELFSTFVTLTGASGRQNLLDGDGSAIVVHENADDHRTQPIGGAGGRVACGAIRPAR